MKALIWNKNKTIRLVDKNIPEIKDNKDAIIKVALSSICTSDLHIIEGNVPKALEGTVLGHEFTGIVVDVAKDVKKFKQGERVAVNCETFCGECFYCKRGFVNNCENGGWLLGCSIDGSQAQYVRVPYADSALVKIPQNMSFKNALFTGDILASGFWSAKLCEIEPDDTVAIIGAGPLGLCASQCAKYMKAKKVILIDINDFRLNIAKKENLADVYLNPKKDNIENEILKLTLNRGADKVIEAAGAHDTFQLAYQIARANAIVAIPAMYEKDQILPLPSMYGKNLIFKTGGVDAIDCEKLIDLLSKKELSTDFLITNEFDFNDIEKAYEFFKNQKEKCLKIAIKYD